MPPRKRSSHSRRKQRQDIIETPPIKRSLHSKRKQRQDVIERQQVKMRLMEITLKVDAHIYQNHLIPAKAAAQYIEEIAVLHQRSCDDVHSLQVAEKLTRLMKQIIAEDKESNDHVASSSRTGTEITKQACSPIQLQHRQQTVVFSVQSHDIIKAIETIHLTDNASNDKAKYACMQNANSINPELVHEAIDNNDTTYTENKEMNLKLQEKDLDNYSQSILTDTEYMNNGQGCKEYDRAWISDVTENNKSRSYNKTCDVENTPVTSTTAKLENNSAKPKRSALKKVCCESIVKKNKNNTTRKKTKQKSVQRKTNRASLNVVRDVHPIAQAAIHINPENEVSTVNTLQLTTGIAAHAPKATNGDKLNINNPCYRTINVTNHTTLKPIQTDLSWIERIKYVRDVNLEEYSTLDGLSESFWNNCEFPPNWDEEDFCFS